MATGGGLRGGLGGDKCTVGRRFSVAVLLACGLGGRGIGGLVRVIARLRFASLLPVVLLPLAADECDAGACDVSWAVEIGDTGDGGGGVGGTGGSGGGDFGGASGSADGDIGVGSNGGRGSAGCGAGGNSGSGDGGADGRGGAGDGCMGGIPGGGCALVVGSGVAGVATELSEGGAAGGSGAGDDGKTRSGLWTPLPSASSVARDWSTTAVLPGPAAGAGGDLGGNGGG